MSEVKDVLKFMDAESGSQEEREALNSLRATAGEVVDNLLATESDISGWAAGANYPPPDLEGVPIEDVEKEICIRAGRHQRSIMALKNISDIIKVWQKIGCPLA